MTKIFYCATIFLSMVTASVIASSTVQQETSLFMDFRAAAFYPQSSLLRGIYGNWQANYAFEVTKKFYDHYGLWVGADWISTTGYTQAVHTKTSFQNVNASFGAKYMIPMAKICEFYVGLGMNGAFAYVHNDYDYVKRNVHKQGLGGVAKIGLYVEPGKYLYLDLFADYLYQQLPFETTVQIGGLKLGGGVGVRF